MIHSSRSIPKQPFMDHAHRVLPPALTSEYVSSHKSSVASNDANSKIHTGGLHTRDMNIRRVEEPLESRIATGKRSQVRSKSATRVQPPADNIGTSSKNPVLDDSLTSIIIEEIRKSSDGKTSVHQYVRGKLLGKGGFAKVYLCTSLDNKKKYAVKIVPKSNLVKSRARQKLQAEIKIHRTLRNKNICEYKHFFEDRMNCYILLELCHNQSMNELIRRRKRLTEPEVMFFMKQLIEGTIYMHENNIIHRDLKLGNLFLDQKMCIKIGDLGLATRLVNPEDRRKTICGTPNYIAPEVIDGKKSGNGHSFQVDIWSMGVILYTWLIGKPPYEAKDIKSTYQRILSNEYSFPSNVYISDDAKDLISAMLQTKPEDRPSLQQIKNHALLTNKNAKIPLAIPDNSTHVAPTWETDRNGQLAFVASKTYVPSSTVHRKKKIHSAAPQSSDDQQHNTRKPLSSVDQNQLHNHNKGPSYSKLKKTNLNEKTSTASANQNSKLEPGRASSANGKKSVAFHIYSDSGSQQDKTDKSDRQRQQVERRNIPSKNNAASEYSLEAITTKISNTVITDVQDAKKEIDITTKRSGISSSKAKKVDEGYPVVSSKSSSSSEQSKHKQTDHDFCCLEEMHSRLTQSFVKAESKTLSKIDVDECPLDAPKVSEQATKWVTRYVDYTSKYGLGFLLNDGSAGVYFNDATKAVLSPHGDVFQYVERRKVEQGDNEDQQRIGEPVCEVHTLASHPASLQKKVTLLKHFHDYLVDQHKRADNNNLDSNSCVAKDEEIDWEFVYLKKWVRTRHAILFRLSNRTVQVVFFDQTEVLLSADARLITYVDKGGIRKTHTLHDVMKEPGTEIAKRLKYARDILQQLIAGSKN